MLAEIHKSGKAEHWVFVRNEALEIESCCSYSTSILLGITPIFIDKVEL